MLFGLFYKPATQSASVQVVSEDRAVACGFGDGTVSHAIAMGCCLQGLQGNIIQQNQNARAAADIAKTSCTETAVYIPQQ